MTADEMAKAAEDRERGHRYRHDCGDCGGPMYQFFSRATWSWSERASHREDNCIQRLRKRIEALEAMVMCDREISSAEHDMRTGAPDIDGAGLGLHDWAAERRIILKGEQMMGVVTSSQSVVNVVSKVVADLTCRGEIQQADHWAVGLDFLAAMSAAGGVDGAPIPYRVELAGDRSGCADLVGHGGEVLATVSLTDGK